MEEIRKNRLDAQIEQAVDMAIAEMPKEYVIKPFLEAHQVEVKGMLLTEYNETETMELFREEGRAEGRLEGRAEGRLEGRAEGYLEAMVILAKEGLLPVSLAASLTGMSEEVFRRKLSS